MKLFRMKRKAENGEEEKELVLETDAEEEAPAEETTEAEADAPTAGSAQVAATPDDPLAQLRAEAAAEVVPEETPVEGGAPAPTLDDPLDPGLLDLFREAKNEVQESTLASELPDIPIQDLLGDLVSVRQELGMRPEARPAPSPPKTRERHPRPDRGGK